MKEMLKQMQGILNHCCFLKYTCEKHPKITYINDEMLKVLRFPEVRDGEIDYLELYKENIFLMLPMEERRRFARYLKEVYEKNVPVAGEITVLRCDGTKAHLYGWVVKCVDKKGKEEFQSICMDITERFQAKKASETERYLSALTEVYDRIFEYDFLNNSVKCICGQSSEVFKWLQNVPMHLEEALMQWIQTTVYEKDRDRVRAYFADYKNDLLQENRSRPTQIRYRALSSSGGFKAYSGIFLKIDTYVSLFCCRRLDEDQEADFLRNENISLRNINENMQELVMRFTDGSAAFEVTGDCVTPLYANENVCEFFGFSREEWLPLMKTSTSIKQFVSRSGVAYEEFIALLETGEAEFTYLDLRTNKLCQIKAICSKKDADDDQPRYVMLYRVNDDFGQTEGAASDKQTVYIRTFGYFDVFVDDKPIAFRNKKSKELFALLVDRRGGYVTSEEAISFLWEDEPVSSVTQARYRKVALRLKNILEEYGIPDIVESVDGKRRIVADKVQCDLYDYLTGKEEYIPLFKGSYLTNYSWAEATLGELSGEHLE